MSQLEAYYTTPPMSAPHNAHTYHIPAIPTAPKTDPPNSQDSVVSTASSTFSAAKLLSSSSSSNLSTTTVAETDVVRPSPDNVALSQGKPTEAPMPTSPVQAHASDARANAPRIDAVAANAPQTGDTAASPMPLASPVTQGFKRSADGSVKGFGTPMRSTAGPAAVHKRNKSMDTHSGRAIGELSAQLKTRLSYAMVKVQNGWEKQSLEELEEVHSGSPNSAPSRSDRMAFDSPSAFDRPRIPSGVSDNSDPMLMSPASDSLLSHGATPSLYWRSNTNSAMNAAANLIQITGSQHGLGLAPAPVIQAGRRRSSSASHQPPSLPGAGQRKHFSDLGHGPRTPATPRAGILRMPSQQAEKDAVDTLLFMSSPNNSQRFPHTNQTAPSPLRADAPQRRVMFDAYPPQERRMVYQPPMPPPQHHRHGSYAAHPAR